MKKKNLLVLSSLFLTFALTSCGNNFPSHIELDEGDDGSVQTPYEEYDNGKRIESISFAENDVSIDLSKYSQYQINASYEPKDAANKDLIYISNDLEKAIVDDGGLITLLEPGQSVVTVSSDTGVSADFTINAYIPATSISIAPHVEGGATLDIYDTKQFSIVTEPGNATQKDVTWTVTDKDGNPSNIATISETGLLSFENAKGVKNVEVYVTATSKYNTELSSTEKVFVLDERKYASSVVIQKDAVQVSDVDVYLNEPVQLTAEVDPSDHTNPVSWSSADSSIATVQEGLVSAVKAQSSTKVKAAIDGLESEVNVNTKKYDVTSVTLDKSELTLNKGQEATLVATVAPDYASFKEVVFSVADGFNEFVSVDENGKVTAKKQTGDVPAKVIAASKDNADIYAECLVTVTNKVTDIELIAPIETFYNGGETYTLNYNKTPSDCEAFALTWESSDLDLATISDQGVVTTNNNELTGTVTFTATVTGTDISDSITVDICKPVAPFEASKMYLVGNRNFASTTIDYEHPSWDDADYAKVMETCPDEQYANQWVIQDFHLERYEETTGLGDVFKFRSADWPSDVVLDSASRGCAFDILDADGNTNFGVRNSEKYDIYFKELKNGLGYQVYIMSEFQNGTMYLVGNRDFSTGTASGEPGVDTSWNDSSKALALEFVKDQYHVAATFDKDDEFKLRTDSFFDLNLGTDEYTSKIAHVDELTKNIVINNNGKYDIYLKSENGVWTVYMHEYVEPVPFMWGIAGDESDWKLDQSKPFVEIEKQGTALYTYKIEGYDLAKNNKWKVTNTDNEWVSNYVGDPGCGIDLNESTSGAFSISDTGDIVTNIAGTYDITLNIYEGAQKDKDGNFYSGMQIIAIKQEGPGPTPVTPTSVTIDQDEPITVENGKTTTLSATIGPDGASGTLIWSSNNEDVLSVDASTGIVTGKADSGSAVISVKVSGYDSLTDSVTVTAAPNSFAWGVASDETDWTLDTTNKFVQVDPEGDALFTYKIDEYTLTKDEMWKVTNTNNEWVSNYVGDPGCGIDLNASTSGAFSIDDKDGNIVTNVAGTYCITLNIFEGANKTAEGIFTSGVQIIARDINEPEPAKDNIMRATVEGVWTDFDLVKNPADETEYMISKSFKKDDALCFHMTGDTWYKYSDLEAGCADVVGSDKDGNIQILEDGTYTFYIHAEAKEGKFVWVTLEENVPQLLINEFAEPVDMVKNPDKESEYMMVGLELETKNSFQIKYDDGEDIYYQDINNVTTDSLSFVENDGSDLIAPKVDGKYDIYFDLNALDGESIKVMEHTEPVVVSDHVIYGKFGEATAWSELTMTQTADKQSQYEYTGDFAAGDVFVIHMNDEDETPWFHFEDVKEGCISLVELDGKENIKIKAAGNYSIYADATPDDKGQHIWIKKNIAPATMTIEGSDPMVMEPYEKNPGEFVLKEVELDTNEFFSFEYDGVTYGFDKIKSDSPEKGKSNIAGHIAVNTAGSYDIYFDSKTINDKCIYIAPHVDVLTYTVDFGSSWAFNDGAKIFAWVWSESRFVECSRVGTTNSITVDLTAETNGFTFVRADSSKTASTVGWPDEGKSWNKSGDLNTTSGTYSYSLPWSA